MYASSTEQARISSFTPNHFTKMSEQELTLCEFQNCQQTNPCIEIDRIRREIDYLSAEGEEFRQDLLASIEEELKTMPASLEPISTRASTEAALKDRLRVSQKRMTAVCEMLRKVENNVHIDVLLTLSPRTSTTAEVPCGANSKS